MLLTIPKITVKSGREITRFSPTGLVFDDGSRVEADLVVFATGYVIYAADRTDPSCSSFRYSRTTIKQVAESLFGSEVAESVRDVGGWDNDGEPAGVWRPSGRKSSC